MFVTPCHDLAISNYEFCEIKKSKFTPQGCKDIGIQNLSFWQRPNYFLDIVL